MALKKHQVPAFDPVVLRVPNRAMLSLSPDQGMNPVLRLHGPTLYNTVSTQAWPPELTSPFIFHILQMFFPPLSLPCFNAPLLSVQPPVKYISLFAVSKQQGEKQSWEAWQSQLPTDIFPCLCQKPGAVSDRKQQRVESAQNHLKGSSDMRAFSRPELNRQAGRVGLH